MDNKYYTHFVLTEFNGSGFGEFTGVVHLNAGSSVGVDSDEARQILAKNFDVDVSDLHIIQFSQIH